MVSIATFTRNPTAMRDGEWISPGPEYDDLELKVRYLGHDFLDMVAAKRRVLSRRHGGDDRIPSADLARINTEALVAHGILDVRGLTNGSGADVTIAEFRQLLLDPDNAELVNVVFTCCNRVGRARDDDLADAVKN
jgi:hypothetical protein